MFEEDIINLATKVLEHARSRGLLIATAESCTGGLIAGSLTEIAGSSDVIDRGFVTYSNAAKQQMLGVSAASLNSIGAVSEAVVKEMAYGALANSMADISIAVTGIAGPGGGSEDKPVGTVWFGFCIQGTAPEAFLMNFGDVGRNEIRRLSVKKALETLSKAI